MRKMGRTEKSRYRGMCSGQWSQEEDQRFLEALQIYGKDWKNITKHVGTRNRA